MSEERPLHVRVAEALGHTVRLSTDEDEFIHDEWGDFLEYGAGHWIAQREHGGWYEVRRYDTDWSATGPLIERCGIGLTLEREGPPQLWAADRWEDVPPGGAHGPVAYHESPLVAVCHVLLALHVSGKLPKP